MNTTRSYQQVMLDHGRNPRNFGAPAAFERMASGRTPGCGDNITVFVSFAGIAPDQQAATVAFDGEGCAVSRASGSLMTIALNERRLDVVRRLVKNAIAFLEGREPADPALGECACFEDIHRFPSRQRCALLAWRAMAETILNEEALRHER
jgi:nitrogen fixation NifU-like protein